MMEQVRRLRRDSQSCPGRPWVTARLYYGSPPGWQMRPTNAGESLRDGRKPGRCLVGAVPKPKIAAVERREARHPPTWDANAA